MTPEAAYDIVQLAKQEKRRRKYGEGNVNEVMFEWCYNWFSFVVTLTAIVVLCANSAGVNVVASGVFFIVFLFALCHDQPARWATILNSITLILSSALACFWKVPGLYTIPVLSVLFSIAVCLYAMDCKF
jgi:hypothetical protein